MLSDVAEFVVQGITVEGKIFEPQDWAENLRDALSRMDGSNNLDCASYVRPLVSNGIRCMLVRSSLQTAHIAAFEHIKQYIADHRLLVRAGRGSRDSEVVEKLLPAGKERRDPNRNKW